MSRRRFLPDGFLPAKRHLGTVLLAGLLAGTAGQAAAECQVQRWILPGGTHAIEGCVVPIDAPAAAPERRDERRAAPAVTEPEERHENAGAGQRAEFSREADTEWRMPPGNAVELTAEMTGWIALGETSAPAVWMVIDPECPACAAAMTSLAAPLADGEVSIRAILTPFLSTASLHRAAEILLAERPDLALLEHEMAKAVGASGTPEEAGYRLSPLGHRMLHENLSWMNAANVTGVPHFLWRDRNGDWQQQLGQPPDAEQIASAMPSAAPSSRLFLPARWPAHSEELPAIELPAREITVADMRAAPERGGAGTPVE